MSDLDRRTRAVVAACASMAREVNPTRTRETSRKPRPIPGVTHPRPFSAFSSCGSYGIRYRMSNTMTRQRKKCARCGRRRALSMFNVDRFRKDGRHPYCTPCKTAPYRAPTGRQERRREQKRARKTKICAACGLRKSKRLFHASAMSVDGYRSHCKRCERAARDSQREQRRYRMNAVAFHAVTTARVAERKRMAIEALGGACVDCGLTPSNEWPVACFDFHHVDTSNKEASVARLLATAAVARILVELRKCVVLCSNCHRRRHVRKGER